MSGKRLTDAKMRSVTRILSLTTQAAALCWVSISYILAGYATIQLGQPFPAVELSEKAIDAILGVNVLKVLGNIFEHNDGVVFGQSKTSETETDGGNG